MRIIKHHPRHYNDSNYRYTRRIAFRKEATVAEAQQAERYAIIKEASGNGATSILLSVAIVVARTMIPHDINYSDALILPGVALVVLAAALVRSNRSHAMKQYEFIDSIVKRGA